MSEHLKNALRRSFLRRHITNFRHRRINDQDYFIASYPKSGNTWLRSLISTAMLGHKPPKSNLNDCIPYIGFQNIRKYQIDDVPRIIKTHEPIRSEYKNAIYMVRDWREVCVSYYYFQKRHARYDGPLSQFAIDFQAGKIDGFGKWTDHVLGWLSASEQKNSIKIFRYEDIEKAPHQFLEFALDFFNIQPKLPIDAVLRLNTRDEMRNDESTDMAERSEIPFVRSTDIGQNLTEFFDSVEHSDIKREFEEVNARLGY